MARRHGQEPAGTGPGAIATAIDPPRPGTLGRADGGPFGERPRRRSRPRWRNRRPGPRCDMRREGQPAGSSRRLRPISCKECMRTWSRRGSGRISTAAVGFGILAAGGSPRATVDRIAPVPLPAANAPERADPMITYEVRFLDHERDRLARGLRESPRTSPRERLPPRPGPPMKGRRSPTCSPGARDRGRRLGASPQGHAPTRIRPVRCSYDVRRHYIGERKASRTSRDRPEGNRTPEVGTIDDGPGST